MDSFNIMSARARLRAEADAGRPLPSPALAEVLAGALSEMIEALRLDDCSCSNPGSLAAEDGPGGPEVADTSPGISTVTGFDGAKRGEVELWSVLYTDERGPYVSSYTNRIEAEAFAAEIGKDALVVNHFTYLP
jgi:hypothetical protein